MGLELEVVKKKGQETKNNGNQAIFRMEMK